MERGRVNGGILYAEQCGKSYVKVEKCAYLSSNYKNSSQGNQQTSTQKCVPKDVYVELFMELFLNFFHFSTKFMVCLISTGHHAVFSVFKSRYLVKCTLFLSYNKYYVIVKNYNNL